MTIGWGGNSNNVTGDSTLDFTLAGLNLADWKIFTGPAEPKGTVSGELKLLAQAGGSKLVLDLGGQVEKFSAMAGNDPRLEPADIHRAVTRAGDGLEATVALGAGGLQAGDIESGPDGIVW